MSSRAIATRWLPVAAVLAALFGATGSGPVWANPNGAPAAQRGGHVDLLQRPAQASPRARMALYNGVAAAGARLVAVGERGHVLLSDDQGQTWRQAKSVPTSVALTSVSFPNARQGWAVGHSGVVLATQDGGETWAVQLDGKRAADTEAQAADADAAGATTPTKRQRNAQGLVADGPDKPLLAVHFVNERRGLVVGAYGLAFETQDGGQTWTSLMGRIDNPGGRHLYHVIATEHGVFITGEQGLLLRSLDGGQRFERVEVNYPGTLFGGLPTPGQGLLVYGLRGNAFLRSGGEAGAWTKVEFGLPVSLTAGTVLRDGGLVVVDETGRVLLSRDGGARFQALSVPKVNAATGVVEATDGGLVVTTARGPARVEPAALRSETKQ